jgi:hypothetical protein
MQTFCWASSFLIQGGAVLAPPDDAHIHTLILILVVQKPHFSVHSEHTAWSASRENADVETIQEKYPAFAVISATDYRTQICEHCDMVYFPVGLSVRSRMRVHVRSRVCFVFVFVSMHISDSIICENCFDDGSS